MSTALIREFMTSNVTSIAVVTPLVEMANIMKTQQLSSVVIVEHGLPIGIVSERDMSNLSAHLLFGGQPPELQQLMSANLVTISAEKSCEHAAELMRRHKIRHVIAIEPTGLLCGVFDQSNLLRSRLYEIEHQYNATAHRVSKLHQSLEDSQAELDRAATQDPLLGIGNRFAMDEALLKAADSGQPYSVAVIDIDYFKRFNDYYNHAHGDKALLEVCQITRLALNNKARLFRQSGNTLLALFCDDELIDKTTYAENILQGVSDLDVPHTTAPLGRISVSIGISNCFTQESEPNHVVFRALNARDAAKQHGGNRYYLNTEHQQRAA